MKKFQIVAREDFQSGKIAERYLKTLKGKGWVLSNEPELVIVIGGDGTMLLAFQKYHHLHPTYVGLHTGTLGFYADWESDDADLLLNKIKNQEDSEIVEYPLVEIQYETVDGTTKQSLALNEMVIKSKTLATFVMQVYINGERFETFRGDGMLVSTPQGSTAYSHSVMGSILHPSLEAMQVSELAAINNVEYRTLNRSFVLPKHHKIEFFIQNSDKDILIGIDGKEAGIPEIVKVEAKVSDHKVKFARYKNLPFWNRVRNKFIGIEK